MEDAENSTSYDYPDWHEFNMSDPRNKAEFIHEYESAQQHDRYAVVIFYIVMFTLIAVVSVHFRFWQFLGVWAVFTTTTGYMLWLCTQRPIPRTTPRLVYSWFLGLYKVSVAAGLSGYLLLILEVFGVGLLLRPLGVPASLSLLMVWYGIYFGILGRDCAEVAADRMVPPGLSHACFALSIGSRRQLAVTVRECSLCNGELADFSGVGGAPADGAGARAARGGDATVQLSCKHCFHDQCIRGWTIVGKKDTCPACLEKVDLRAVFQDRPWETRNLSWIQMLDAVRYLVVWNPLILILLHYGLHYLGLERHIHHRAPHAAAPGANGTALNGTGAAGLLAALGNGTGGAGAGLLGESGAAALANATLVGAIAQAAGGAGGGQAGVQR